jgi:hypothetical protein
VTSKTLKGRASSDMAARARRRHATQQENPMSTIKFGQRSAFSRMAFNREA